MLTQKEIEDELGETEMSFQKERKTIEKELHRNGWKQLKIALLKKKKRYGDKDSSQTFREGSFFSPFFSRTKFKFWPQPSA